MGRSNTGLPIIATTIAHRNNTEDRDDRGRPEQAISVHHFRFWGALGKSALFVGCGLGSLLIALVSLGGAILATRSSYWEPVLWGAFALMGAISAGACLCAAVRLFTRIPSTIALYRSGLGWVEKGRERKIPWTDFKRVERNVQVFVVAGKPRRSDAVLLAFADGKSVQIWAEVLTDYPAFADFIEHLHGSGSLESGVPARAKLQRMVTRRCWHCGGAVEVTVADMPVTVSCPSCNAGLGMM